MDGRDESAQGGCPYVSNLFTLWKLGLAWLGLAGGLEGDHSMLVGFFRIGKEETYRNRSFLFFPLSLHM